MRQEMCGRFPAMERSVSEIIGQDQLRTPPPRDGPRDAMRRRRGLDPSAMGCARRRRFALQFLAFLLGSPLRLDLEGFALLLRRLPRRRLRRLISFIAVRHLLRRLDIGNRRPVDVVAVGVDLGLQPALTASSYRLFLEHVVERHIGTGSAPRQRHGR